MTGRLATHQVDVYETRSEEPTDSIAAAPVHTGLTCHLMTQEQGRALLSRIGVEFDAALGITHYLLAVGRYADRLKSGRVVQVTHEKCPVLRHWKPAAEAVRYLVLSTAVRAGASRHSYAALRKV